MRYQSRLNMDWGHVLIEGEEDGILSIGGIIGVSCDGESNENEWTRLAKQQMTEYFQGIRTEFELPLIYRGTEFQNKVWKALLTIPYGTTVSYRDICDRIGNPRAYQAVGTAVGKNPFFVVVPCHRVIASDGTIGGYALGLDMKRILFGLEGIQEKR